MVGREIDPVPTLRFPQASELGEEGRFDDDAYAELVVILLIGEKPFAIAAV